MAEEYGRLTTRPVLPTVAVDVIVMGVCDVWESSSYRFRSKQKINCKIYNDFFMSIPLNRSPVSWTICLFLRLELTLSLLLSPPCRR
jgi:hypothetical protein